MSDATVNQPTPRPTAKVTAAAVGGLVTSVAILVLDWVSELNWEEAGWGGLVATVVAGVSGYLKKSRVSEA